MSAKYVSKRDREHIKRDRADQKRVRRQDRRDQAEADSSALPRPESEILAELASLHEEHHRGRIDFATFEAARTDLLSRLST